MSLGKLQSQCLQTLLDNGGAWHPQIGWRFGDSNADMIRQLRTLEKRGLVELYVTEQRIEWRVFDAERAWGAVAAAQAAHYVSQPDRRAG